MKGIKTIANKLFFGVIFIFLSWYGLDGLFVNYSVKNFKSFDIREIETKGFTDYQRYMQIKNGVAPGPFIYFEEEHSSFIKKVIYPIVSYDNIVELESGKKVKVKVLVERTNVDLECLDIGSCLKGDSSIIKGVSKTGIEKLDAETQKMLKDERIEIDDDVILITDEEHPRIWYWNTLMFVGGLLASVTILKSFFRRSTCIEDWYSKITEQKS